MSKKEIISNWGNFPKILAEKMEAKNVEDLYGIIKKSTTIIARGNGRCYGDSSLQTTIFSTLKLNKILFFDKINGVIRCESGVLLSEILETIVPDNFFLPVTPGTKFITVGGAVASNIHGKNHHLAGSFGNYIISFELIIESGERLNCSETENRNYFFETIGGNGQNGIITSVTFKLKKVNTSFVKQKKIKAENLELLLDYFEKNKNASYSVAWLDCQKKGKYLGRGIFQIGEHAEKSEIRNKPFIKLHKKNQISIPPFSHYFLLNKFTGKLFNFLIYYKQIVKEKSTILHYDNFFYPLDKVKNWNTIYGKKGLIQYQFVIPFHKGQIGLKEIITIVSRSGCTCFLAVLKALRNDEKTFSPLSFTMEGYTLALDFKNHPNVLLLLDELDQIVLKYKGRIYLTKDARMSKEMFKSTYPDFIKNEKFKSIQTSRIC